MLKKYIAREKISEDIVEQLLHNRGIKTEEEKTKFLNPDFEKHLHDPFLFDGMQIAIDRIFLALEKNEKIGIWSDYDADGIPGGALLHDFFKMIGFDNFTNYIPNRHSEGYGLNIEGLTKLKESGVGLIITIDCGTRDIDVINKANELGIDIIITDHHEAGEDLPNAYAILNHKIKNSKYPEQVLCGAGVVWKLIEALLQNLRNREKTGLLSERIKLPNSRFEKWLLDLVGLATLSDMVPLLGENRVLAHFGLRVLKKTKRTGLKKMYSSLKINLSNVSEDDVSFLITPRINAASRMGSPIDAFDLLTVRDEIEANRVVDHLNFINNERKSLVAGIVKEAKKKLKQKFQNEGERPVIVLGDVGWRPAVLGLVANSIADEYGCPTFVWGKEDGEIIKGSCRSNGIVDLVKLMESSKNSFLDFGGHKFSGGFSVSYEKIHSLEEELNKAHSNFPMASEEEILVDAEFAISKINEGSVDKILQLAPFGIGNEKPIFIFRDVIPQKVSRFGKEKNHLEIVFIDGSKKVRAIGFFRSPDDWGSVLKEGMKTNLVANIEKSFWNGRSEIRLRIVDFF